MYSLPNPNVHAQPQSIYNSRTPSPSEYMFPNKVVNPYGHVAHPLSGKLNLFHLILHGCFISYNY